MDTHQGILLVDKTAGDTSFSLVQKLRKILNVRKIGHAGTLDPFATGVMVLLVGRDYTKQSARHLNQTKEYLGTVQFGVRTDTYDCCGVPIAQSTPLSLPTKAEIEALLPQFQGDLLQVPPMYSAKKVHGKKLYQLAREGKVIEREPVKVHVKISLLEYTPPHLKIHVTCSKGTYIRSLANDLGNAIGCGAHLSALRRLRSGDFTLEQCIDGKLLFQKAPPYEQIASSLLQT